MVEINGAQGEGGGQILRTSLALSALTGKPLHIHDIRANRSQPGLRPQHLAAVKAIARITQADCLGAHPDSMEVTLSPSTLRSGRYQFDIATAGSLTLLLQTIFLPLSFAPGVSRVTLTGGTHVLWSPLYEYLKLQWLPAMGEIGFRVECHLQQAGFYPAGGGEVEFRISPVNELHPFKGLVRGELVHIRGLSGVANLEDSIARRQKHRALQRLYPVCGDTKIKTSRMTSPGKGTFILLKAEFVDRGSACFTALGAPGKPAERVADEAVDQMLSFLSTDGCIDRFLADQLLLPLSLVNGRSVFRTDAITQHLLTNAAVIRQFLPVNITIEGGLDQPGVVRIFGGNQPITGIHLL